MQGTGRGIPGHLISDVSVMTDGYVKGLMKVIRYIAHVIAIASVLIFILFELELELEILE